MKRLALLVLALSGCPAAYPDAVSPGDPPECGYAALGRITAAYTAALVLACPHEPDLDHCPAAQKDPVRQRFAPDFQRWEDCPP